MQQLFDIRDFGAIPDGQTLNTTAIQQAIDACHMAGGGQVYCGPGQFLTGALELKSQVELHLTAGCRLLGSPNLADYSPLVAEGFRTDMAPEGCSHSLIRAVNADNLAITGMGTIDGGGLAFYPDQSPTGKLAKPATPRPRLGMFYRCRALRLEGVTLVDAPCWTLWLMQCDGAHLHRLTITGNRRMRNVDGIDLDACRNVTVSDCRIDTEDDCLVLRAIQLVYDTPAVCENITISNCVLSSGCQGVRVGCPSDATIRNCTFNNLVINSSYNGIVFDNPKRYYRTQSPVTAHISNILFANLVIHCARTPILIAVEDGIPLRYLGDISFSDCRIHSGGPCVIQGSPQALIRRVSFTHLRISTTGDDAILTRHCQDISLNQVTLDNRAGSLPA